MSRLAEGGRVDRQRRIGFTFNGRRHEGCAGDTLASALVANDVTVVGRSFKYHRPRGLVAAGEDEPNAIVQLGSGADSEPNHKATRVELYDGLMARSVNCWPSASLDLGAAAELFHRFLPAGFYYKTFMGGPGWFFWEQLIRKAAGLGTAPTAADPDAYLKRHVHCDVLVVGAGPAGLAAARAAAQTGADVLLADDQNEPGGSLLWHRGRIDGMSAQDWVASTEAALRQQITYLSRTTVFGYYDHNHLMAVERVSDHLPPSQRLGRPRQRLWSVRARRVVLATGALERPVVFPDNDRPGVMLADAARHYAYRYGAAVGRRAVVMTNNDGAYRCAIDLQRCGMEIAAILDTRTSAGLGADEARAAGIPLHVASHISNVAGQRRVRGVRIGPRGHWLDCDTLLMSGGWTPTVHLFSQSGGKVRWNEDVAAFAPYESAQPEQSVGAAAGRFTLAECLADGHAAGLAGRANTAIAPPRTEPEPPPRVQPFIALPSRRRQWVDLQSDVTDKDVRLAAQENYSSVEHLKRYTTTGMATDQGKTSNLNALSLLGELTGQSPERVGTTRFRPPYAPVAMSAIAAGAAGDLYAPRRTVPADAAHRELGAVFDDFGHWQRPDYYPRPGEDREAAARREHLAVRRGVGLFEGSPIGKIEVSGRDAASFLHLMYANSVADLAAGRVRYGLMLNENGVIVDDALCARLAPDFFLLHPSSGAAARVMASLEEGRQCEYPELDVHIADVTSAWATFAVAGPRSREILRQLSGDIDLSATGFPHMAVRLGLIEGVPCRLLRVSFSGELQFEISVPSSYGEALWQRLMKASKASEGTPVGIEAWLRLRLEKGHLHVGSDTDGTTTPDDVGFGNAIARKKEDFVGRRSLSRLAMRRADREQLVGLSATSPSDALPVGACLFTGNSFKPPMFKEGRVTSSCFSPVLNAPLALAMVRAGRSRFGERISVYAEGAVWQATICRPVFYDPKNERLHG
jgi:sarcosine oxidase subunit alpha